MRARDEMVGLVGVGFSTSLTSSFQDGVGGKNLLVIGDDKV